MSAVNADSVRAVAKKDFQDAVRSYLFWGLAVFFFVLMGGAAFLVQQFTEEAPTTTEFMLTLSGVTKLLIPLIALLLGWKAIAGERESGSIKVLLSLPHSRKDVVLGKLIGRTTVVSVALVVGFAIAAAIVALSLPSFSITEYVGFLAMTILYALAYLAIAITLSSITDSTTVAGALVFTVFVLFYVLWNLIQTGFQILMRLDYIEGVTVTIEEGIGGQGTTEFTRLPDWAYFIDTLDPGNAYQNALTVVSSGEGTDVGSQFAGFYTNEQIFPEGIPFYLQDWFSFIVLLVWIVVPVAVALYAFDRADL